MFWAATSDVCLHVRVSSLRDVVGGGGAGGTARWLGMWVVCQYVGMPVCTYASMRVCTCICVYCMYIHVPHVVM